MFPKLPVVALLLVPALLAAQDPPDMQKVLERLDRLEQENRSLINEIRALRQELEASHTITGSTAQGSAVPAETGTANNVSTSAAAEQTTASSALAAQPEAPVAERVTILERRMDEQAQTKVEASQKFPVTLTGMVLFNAFLNGKANNAQEDPTAASLTSGTNVAGANLAQSVIGLLYQGPRVLGGGQVNGSLYMDLSAALRARSVTRCDCELPRWRLTGKLAASSSARISQSSPRANPIRWPRSRSRRSPVLETLGCGSRRRGSNNAWDWAHCSGDRRPVFALTSASMKPVNPPRARPNMRARSRPCVLRSKAASVLGAIRERRVGSRLRRVST